VIKKFADAYRSLTANLKAGRYGRPGSTRPRNIADRGVEVWGAVNTAALNAP
jgi:hypothetical protein